MRNAVRVHMAAAAGAAFFLLFPVSASGACRDGAEIGPGIFPESGLSEEISSDGIEIWQDAQEKQRQLTEMEAELEGGWSVTLLGRKRGEQFSGTACFESLGTEEMTGRIFLTEGQNSREYLFRNSRVLVRKKEEEREAVLEPEKWTALTEGLTDRTTYDLDYVKSLQTVRREDGSTELSYELDQKRTAEWTEPVLRQAFLEKGLSLPEEPGWLILDEVKGDLTVSHSGYMTVDYLRAAGSAAFGNWKADLEFEISVVYKET